MSDWDNFDLGKHESHARPQANSGVSAKAPHGISAPVDGHLDALSFFHMIKRNFFKISILTVLLTVLGVAAVKFSPFPYVAKAIVLVDPRQKGVQISEEVVRDIGGDAAVLESIVELLTSDGFLRPLLKQLKVAQDPEYKDALKGANGDTRKLLAQFKKSLKVERLGATYVLSLIHISEPTRQEAISYAVFCLK